MPCLSIAIRSMPIPNAKPLTLLGVVADVPEDVGVDHAGAEDLQPAGALAHGAAACRARAP